MLGRGFDRFASRSVTVGLLLVVAAAGSVGCSGSMTFDSSAAPTAKSILADPERFHDTQVTLHGEVGDTIDLGYVRTYQLRDETGEIPVVTEGQLPVRGAQISVTGLVHKEFPLHGQTQPVLKISTTEFN
jgi:uncharacterized protein YdeI (BOF family)